jgi:uncharacterized protein YjbI with pentapeptide repeats
VDLWMIIAVGLAILTAATVPGVYFFWPSRTDPVCRSDLGVALMTGALVAFAILALQVMVDVRLRGIEETRQEQTERQNLELQLAMQTEPLPGIALRDRDLSNFYLYRKVLPGAILDESDLTETQLTGANLDGAFLNDTTLVDTQLDGANLTKAELKDAVLAGANLTGAVMPEAQLDRATLDGTKFGGANLRGAFLNDVVTTGRPTEMLGTDLTGADLRGADLSRAYFEGTTLTGARYNSKTKWPLGYEQDCTPGKTCRVTGREEEQP